MPHDATRCSVRCVLLHPHAPRVCSVSEVHQPNPTRAIYHTHPYHPPVPHTQATGVHPIHEIRVQYLMATPDALCSLMQRSVVTMDLLAGVSGPGGLSPGSTGLGRANVHFDRLGIVRGFQQVNVNVNVNVHELRLGFSITTRNPEGILRCAHVHVNSLFHSASLEIPLRNRVSARRRGVV
jgi:hypothetical protein